MFIVLGAIAILSITLVVITNGKVIEYKQKTVEKQKDNVVTDKDDIDNKEQELLEENIVKDSPTPSNKNNDNAKVEEKKNNDNHKTENNSNKTTNKPTNNKASTSNKNEQSNKESNKKNETQAGESGVIAPNNTSKPTENSVTVEDKPWDLLGITKDDYYNKPVYNWARVDYPVSSCGSVSNCESLCMKDAEELAFTENVSCIQIYTYSGKYLGEMLSRK